MTDPRDQHAFDPTSGRSPRGRDRGVLVTLLVAIVVALVTVTVTVLVMAPRGREAIEASTATESPVSTPSASAESSTASPSPSQLTADGCLGGSGELNRAMTSAQEQAPLTGEGAAAFTATLLRWASVSPAPAYKADTATQILAQDATTLVRDWVAAESPVGLTASADFAEGRFYIESYTTTRATVSFLANASGTQDGNVPVPATISGAVTLVAQNGTWHLQDLTSERSVSDLSAVSSPYTGGC